MNPDDSVEVTLSYINDEGDDVEYTQTITHRGLTALLLTMDEHVADD